MKKHIMIFAAVMLFLGVAGEALQAPSRPSEPQPGTPEWQQSCVRWNESFREKAPTIATYAQYDEENCRSMANCLQRAMKALGLPENNMQVQTQCQHDEQQSIQE